MTSQEKQQLLNEAQAYVVQVIQGANVQIPEREEDVARTSREFKAARSPDVRAVKGNLLALFSRDLEALRNTSDSPFFSRCDTTNKGTLHIGKFSLPSLGIYSWISPIAKIRFEQPGEFSYTTEDGTHHKGILTRNDHYLIANGHITFMTTQSSTTPRTLIYQEYFSNRKSTFILPEIVERMEKAQDNVIRAHYRGSFLIAGPAGSGKTTLALHRIAYLLQAPETASLFDPKNILVLVQDESTEKYFQQLLPSLGIHDVTITTFSTWARNVLSLQNFAFQHRYGESEHQRDHYEWAKNTALQKINADIAGIDPFDILTSVYSPSFSPDLQTLLSKQKQERILDRFDLTVLLKAKMKKEGTLTHQQKVYAQHIIGRARSHITTIPLTYSLILLDEIQNYLPQQVDILRSCISSETNALTYVGDLAQRTTLGALDDWSKVGESFPEGRTVTLEKVYRSTRQIVEYIRSVGYEEIEVPSDLRDGETVEEIQVSTHEERRYIQEVIKKNESVLIGILSVTPERIQQLHTLATTNVRVMTVAEAQGVEFDVVCFLAEQWDEQDYLPELRNEKRRVIRDQVYVGLTRAVNRLYVLGEITL